MDAALLADPATTALSGRFLFALDDGRGDTAALDADVTMLATPGGDLALTLPGVPGSLRLPSDQAPAAAHAAALLFLAAARASGTRAWRVAELPPGQALSTATLAELAARVPGTRTAPAPETPAPYGGPRPGPTPPRDGRSALHTLAPLGRLTAYQWRELAELAARHGAGTLRATPWRGVVVPGLSPARAAEAAAGLARAGLVTVKGSSWEGVGACTGRPGCVKSLADVRADARAALDAAPGAFLSTGPVASAAAATPGVRPGWTPWRPAPATTWPTARPTRRRSPGPPDGTYRRTGCPRRSRPPAGPHRPPGPRGTAPSGKSESRVFEYEKDGAAIYRESFATIRAEADLSGLPPDVAQVAVRMIHACGMTDLPRDLGHTPQVVARAREALRAGAPILCDANMVASGVTRKRLPADNEVICTLADPSVPELAARLGTTRSAAALELWRDRLEGAVVAVGNAPTALFRLLEMIEEGAPRPAAVIGVPVGFVGAAESKDELAAHPSGLDHLIVRGRRGGSAMAAAALNAIASETE